MTKQTLKHTCQDGAPGTRNTARVYTHVVEARVDLSKCNDPEYNIKQYGGLSVCGQYTKWAVLSWAGREDLAVKAAAKFENQWSAWQTKVVAINNGVSAEPVQAPVAADADAPASEAVVIESGLTGPDWEPTAATKFYAQCGKRFEFGATEAEAIAKLAPQTVEVSAMSLTTETAVIAIAQVQAAYNCSDLDAITRMQGAAAEAGDEASLEVLCAIKGVLIAQVVGPFKIQTQGNNGVWRESGALMNFDSGDWEPTVYATEAEGLAAACKHWNLSLQDVALFCRAVVVGSADDLGAVIREKVRTAKCLNKNALAYASHGNVKDAGRLRAKRDAYMAVARDAKARMAELASVERADYTHCTGCSGTGLDPRDGFTSHQPCLGQGGLYIEPATKIETRKATMRHTAMLEVELAYNRAKSLAGVNLANAVDELASAWNAMSGDALRDELRKLVTAHKVHVNGAHTARVNAGVNGVDRKVFADEI